MLPNIISKWSNSWVNPCIEKRGSLYLRTSGLLFRLPVANCFLASSVPPAQIIIRGKDGEMEGTVTTKLAIWRAALCDHHFLLMICCHLGILLCGHLVCWRENRQELTLTQCSLQCASLVTTRREMGSVEAEILPPRHLIFSTRSMSSWGRRKWGLKATRMFLFACHWITEWVVEGFWVKVEDL